MPKEVSPKCGHCGSTKFRYPKDNEPNGTVACTGCDATWSYSEFKRETVNKTAKVVADLIRDFTKGNPGGKLH